MADIYGFVFSDLDTVIEKVSVWQERPRKYSFNIFQKNKTAVTVTHNILRDKKTNAIIADHTAEDLSSLVSTPEQLPAVGSDDISCSIFGFCSGLFCCWLLHDKLISD